MCFKKNNESYNTEKLGKLTKHHLVAKKNGGARNEFNISYVPEKLHQAFHLLFHIYTPTKIAQIINEHWIPRDITMVALNEEELKLVEDVLSKHHLKKY